MRVQDRFLGIALSILKIGGQDPRTFGFKEKLWTLFWLLNLVVNLTLSGVALYYTMESDAIVIARNIEGIMGQLHIFTRIYPLLFLKPLLVKLCQDRLKFWDFTDFEDCVFQKITLFFKTVLKLLTTLFTIDGVACAMYAISPALIMRDRSLPFGSHVWEAFPCYYEILYVSQCFAVAIVMLVAMGFDMLFASFCVELIVQFKLLNHKLRTSKAVSYSNVKRRNPYLDILKDCVDYHNYLLEYCSGVRSYFEMFLLLEYLLKITSVCMQLYVISENMDNVSLVIRCTMMATALLGEMVIYCFFSEALKSEALDTALAAYESDWLDTYLKQGRITMTMIIMRASIPVGMTAGKMLMVDRQLFEHIVRTSMSFFTLLRTLKYQGEE
ncbi:Odorant receptor Or64 [Rhyzopertha dominica]|nr:Odorant receptor Or64 [Rhyzopertha dominica]